MTTATQTTGLPAHPPSDFRWREQFTLAWLHAVCSPNLAVPLDPKVDDGVDAVIRFQRRNGVGHLDTQVKSITPNRAQTLSTGGHLRYPLSRTRAQKLTSTNTFPVGLFTVVEVPDDPQEWCTRPGDEPLHLRLFSRSWWALVARPDVAVPTALTGRVVELVDGDTDDVRIDLHDERHLDALALNELLNAVAAWQTSRGGAA